MSPSDVPPVRPPSRLLQMMESRAVFELGAFLAASPMLRCLGRGDRHPVLVLPGFTGDDRSTEPLRWALRSQGFWAHAWHLGPNLGPTPRTLDGLSERLDALHDRHGMQVTVVGWSLGGIYARHLARLHPDMVRQVITLGSPFRMREGDKSAATPLWDALSPGFAVEMAGMLVPEADKPPLTVPATAIYTRSDGVVRWWTCLESEGPTRENIEVRGSHSGLGFNPAALYAVADRLAQPDGTWTPFRPPLGMRHLYPRAASFRSKEPLAA